MKNGEVYQHYKEVNYTFKGIVMPLVQDFIDWDLINTIKAKDEATLEEIDVYEYQDYKGVFIHFSESEIPHALYESHKDGQLWLRNVKDFFGPVVENSQLRFTKVED